MKRWSMGDAAPVAEAEVDSGVSVGWFALVVLAGGILGAYLASSVRHRRGGSSSSYSSGAFWGRTAPRPLLGARPAARPVEREPERESEPEPKPEPKPKAESSRAEASRGDRDAALPKPSDKARPGKRVQMVQLRKR